jgi:hypothetical protein
VSIITLPTKWIRDGLGGEQQVADTVREDAIDLLRHCPVEAPQPRLNVRDLDSQLGGHQGAGDRGVDIAHHDYDVGPLFQADGLESADDLGGLDRV